MKLQLMSSLLFFSTALEGFAGSADFVHPIPADKNLSPAWIAALTAPGEAEVLRGSELDYIGMPVGGLCAGLVYLGGDGQLWLWDIFNDARREGIDGKTAPHEGKDIIPRDGSAYVGPRTQSSPLQQGFALSWKNADGETHTRTLNRAGGWADLSFTGSYPLGHVSYRDPAVPVTVDLVAYSPFIPLNIDDSSLPATVLRYTLTNPGTTPVTVTLSGWLENVIGTQTCPPAEIRRSNQVKGATLIATVDKARPDWTPPTHFRRLRDIGTMALTFLDSDTIASAEATAPAPVMTTADRPLGGVRTEKTIPAGGTLTVTAVIAWHFPNAAPASFAGYGVREYSTRFADAAAVVNYVSKNFARLEAETMRWSRTWNDSTLPRWALDRTFLNTSILATTTAYRFEGGRFWGWEGIGACEGTCTHVWGYGQAMGRLFPALERDLRTRTDFGSAFIEKTGVIHFRGDHGFGLAIDGQAMSILRAWREHTMTTDDAFLRPLWPKVKLAMERLISQDRGDGLLEGSQHNTLDSDWHGQNAWLCGLYHAALRACEAMAADLGDPAFAERCRAIRLKGERSMVEKLYNGEYFINLVDPKFPNSVNSGSGCHIDQVLGQSWAFQAGLGRILPAAETRSALQSLWRYNFAPDAGPWRELNKPGRWYGLPGDAGLIMTTFPRPDWNYLKAAGNNPETMWAAKYYNEYMTGFEWQVAGHMIHEGMVTEGLAIARAIHDRYAPAKRNPYNEIECSDHYARAMASYGVFTALCGYRYHGPSGLLAFAPKLSPDHFKAAFTSAEGWGSYAQQRSADGFTATLDLAYGKLTLKTLGVQTSDGFTPTQASGRIAGREITGTIERVDGETLIHWTQPVVLAAGESLVVTLHQGQP
jgi:non-lysosomal glucosylceramidase